MALSLITVRRQMTLGMKSLLLWLRWSHWGGSKFPFALWAITAGYGFDGSTDFDGLLMAFTYAFSLLAFGYTFNDLCDFRYDERAGKAMVLKRVRPGARPMLPAILLTCGVVPAILSGGVVGAVMCAGLILAVAYSMPWVRLKGRGVFGIVTAAIAQWSVPAIVAAARFGVWEEMWPFIVIGGVAGCRWMLIHQAVDLQADRGSGQETLGTRSGISALQGGIRWCLLVERIGIGMSVLYFALPRPVLAVALAATFLLSLVFEAMSPLTWDKDFAHVSLASYYLILAPVATYPFVPVVGICMLVIHVMLVRRFLVGDVSRCWFAILKGKHC